MSVLTLAAAKSHLRINVDSDDAELQLLIDSSEAVIAHRCGPLTSTPKTSRVDGGRPALLLMGWPVLSLTSVTPVGGTAITLTDLYLDADAGLVTLNLGGAFTAPTYDVVYACGRVAIPADLLDGIKELVRHRWDTRTRPANALKVPVNPATYLLPYLVRSLIELHLIPYGFA